ncbi:coiled-coil domain-containing protein 87-like [Oncorhynchus clarkii lewisi]|uniref:coiled-coil domain-containing protein 87-like n=1 Tax=Oncorhynchus clarkii lewisi TaxID=490388 RepID=UPI0039B88166
MEALKGQKQEYMTGVWNVNTVLLRGLWKEPDLEEEEESPDEEITSPKQATAAWERTARLIQQRESLLARLEMFDRDASDPKCFFLQGYQGTSLARLDESKHRSKLNSQICSLEKVLSKILHHITDSFHDTVTYKGRPYREKMRWDRIEMLYWLQQERRVQALERVVEGRGSLPTRLPPPQLTSASRPFQPTSASRGILEGY